MGGTGFPADHKNSSKSDCSSQTLKITGRKTQIIFLLQSQNDGIFDPQYAEKVFFRSSNNKRLKRWCNQLSSIILVLHYILVLHCIILESILEIAQSYLVLRYMF